MWYHEAHCIPFRDITNADMYIDKILGMLLTVKYVWIEEVAEGIANK